MNDQHYTKKKSFLARIADCLLISHFREVNRTTEWHRLGNKWYALLNLLAFRAELREHNLHDTDGDLTQPKEESPGKVCPFHNVKEGKLPAKYMRTPSGTQNDMQFPAMGCRYSRLGRNVPRSLTAPDLERLMKPNPLLVSQRLLARRKDPKTGQVIFKPAETLNLLAAAWIQFQVHDWFSHEKEEVKREDEPIEGSKELFVPKDGDWQNGKGMRLPRTKRDFAQLTSQDTLYPAYRNEDPQWWDASQIYGETEDEIDSLRRNPTTGELCPSGRLYIDDDGFLPTNPNTGSTVSGFSDNWWLGLEILHTLFVKEHNAICDELEEHENRDKHLSGDEIFEKARLVNAAIMAKIHTVEWTPGILSHPAIKPALDANWMGLLGHLFGEGLARKIARFLPNGVIKDVFTGIPLSETDHHGAPYALTEEFNAVYRLHPLIPETVELKSYRDEGERHSFTMEQIAFEKARTPFNPATPTEESRSTFEMADAVYSFGTTNPGQITIGNYPEFLRNLRIPKDPPRRAEEQVIDLAAVDILRDRERGVPRYNEFLRQLHKQPVKDWMELAGQDPKLARELEDVYEGKLEDVDTMVGMFCEPLPQGFGFSDTAFRIFILMASRRLKSDRFFTSDYTEEIYTNTGLEWIRETGMKEVIERHYPELREAIRTGDNPFGPWRGKPVGAKHEVSPQAAVDLATT